MLPKRSRTSHAPPESCAAKRERDNSPTKVGASHATHGITSPTLTREGTIRALCKITRAEMWSRSVINPQAVQTCSRSDNRFGTAAPQIHVWLVPGAWTGINSRPAVSALYVARRKRGHRRGQAVLLLQKIHQHIAQQRADFQPQLCTWLVQNYGTIAVEDLNVQGLAGSMLAKFVHDAGWAGFFQKLGRRCATRSFASAR